MMTKTQPYTQPFMCIMKEDNKGVNLNALYDGLRFPIDTQICVHVDYINFGTHSEKSLKDVELHIKNPQKKIFQVTTNKQGDALLVLDSVGIWIITYYDEYAKKPILIVFEVIKPKPKKKAIPKKTSPKPKDSDSLSKSIFSRFKLK